MKRIKILSFEKRHGLGNDFVIIWADDLKKSKISLNSLKNKAHIVCDRHFGVGADQILLLQIADRKKDICFKMQVLNADGSWAEMCGNGIRAALGSYCDRYSLKPKQGEIFKVKSAAGVHELFWNKNNLITVGMGIPQIGKRKKVAQFFGYPVQIGNPHFVIKSEDVSKVPLNEWGIKVETHSAFPNRTNGEWVQVIGPKRIRIRVWERGAGATLACGTGACAAAVVAIQEGWVTSPVSVELPGGELQVHWKKDSIGSEVQMTGPQERVFSGRLLI